MLAETLFGPMAVRDPTDDFWYGPPGRKTTSGEAVSEDTALTYTGCWAATTKIAGTLASLPLKLFERRPDGGRSELRSDPLWFLLHDEPNAEMDSYTFLEMIFAWWVNYGNGTAEIEREVQDNPDSPIVALWPIHPTRVRYERKDGEVRYFIRNKMNDRKDGYETELASHELLNIVGPLSPNGIVGRGVIHVACESIGIGLAIEKHQGSFFGNGTMLSGVLQHPRKPSQEARDNMRREWREIHQGAGKHYKVATLWEGVTFTATGQDAESSQMIESATFRVSDMARAYDLPPHTLKELSHATFSNIDAQQISLVVDSYTPRLERTERAMKRQLLNRRQKRRGLFMKFIVDGLLRGDPVKRAQVNKTKLMHGSLTINEWLAQDEKNPIGPDGDRRFIPANLIPLDQAGEASGNGGPGGENEMPERPDASITALRHEVRQIVRQSLSQAQENESSVAIAWLNEVARRLIAKDCNEVRRAASKEANFVAWLDGHYAKFRATIADACSGPAQALQVDAAAIAEEYTSAAMERLLQACEGDRDGFEARVAAVLDSWRRKQGELIHVG